jgi:hypothetical protein
VNALSQRFFTLRSFFICACRCPLTSVNDKTFWGHGWIGNFNELKPDGAAALLERPAWPVASVNTHDMPPFAGFWQARDLDERQRAGLLTTDDAGNELRRRETLLRAFQSFLDDDGYVKRFSGCGRSLCSVFSLFARQSVSHGLNKPGGRVVGRKVIKHSKHG